MAAPGPYYASPSADHCRRGRQCSKLNGHKGRCNSERRVYAFWEASPVYKLNVRKRSLTEEEERVGEELAAKAARLDTLETELRTFALIVSAHPYCARNSHATSCIERAR